MTFFPNEGKEGDQHADPVLPLIFGSVSRSVSQRKHCFEPGSKVDQKMFEKWVSRQKGKRERKIRARPEITVHGEKMDGMTESPTGDKIKN